MAFGDVANDGKVDVLILNVGEPPTLLLNCTRNGNRSVLLKLIGTKSNKAAIGARVTVRGGGFGTDEKCRAGEAIFRKTICACTLGWAAIRRLIRSRSNSKRSEAIAASHGSGFAVYGRGREGDTKRQ